MRKTMISPNNSKQTLSFKMTILSLLVTGLLSGCGIKGSLKTPPPIFGGQAKVNPDRVPTEDLDTNDDTDDDYTDLDDSPLVDP